MQWTHFLGEQNPPQPIVTGRDHVIHAVPKANSCLAQEAGLRAGDGEAAASDVAAIAVIRPVAAAEGIQVAAEDGGFDAGHFIFQIRGGQGERMIGRGGGRPVGIQSNAVGAEKLA